jgi:hypothetical protein
MKSLKWRKRAKRGRERGWEKGVSAEGFQPFFALFFSISHEIASRTPFFSGFHTFLYEKRGKLRQETKRMAKRAKENG